MFNQTVISLGRRSGRQYLKRAIGYPPCSSLPRRCLSSNSSPWAGYEMAPADPIIGLNEEYNLDDFPQKVIVGVGAYRDDAGKPYVLPCVHEAEKIMLDSNLDMEYSGIVSSLRHPSCYGYCRLLSIPFVCLDWRSSLERVDISKF